MGFPNKQLGRNIRTIDASTLTTSFQNVGNITTLVGYKVALVNASNKDVQITDGTSQDNWYIPAGSTLAIGEGLSSYAAQQDRQCSLLKGAQLQVKLPSGVAGTGIIVITVEGN